MQKLLKKTLIALIALPIICLSLFAHFGVAYAGCDFPCDDWSGGHWSACQGCCVGTWHPNEIWMCSQGYSTYPEGCDSCRIDFCTVCEPDCRLCREGGGGGGGGCFLPNTKITTPEGERDIQELKVGDKVIGMDTDKKEKKETSVENIYQTEREGYYEIELEGSDGTRHLVRVTGEHPLWANRKLNWKTIWETLLARIREFFF